MSSDECLSPLMSLKQRQTKNQLAVPSTTPSPLPKRENFSKLSLKKWTNKQDENLDPLKTPTMENKQKVTASFIFSSCKKKKAPYDNLLPGHTILVDDSSDEEFVGDVSTSPGARPNSTVVDDSLVEYSLIRKWLQNAQDSSSSLEGDSSPGSASATEDLIFHLEKKSKPKSNPSKSHETFGDDTIILSSDDESATSFANFPAVKTKAEKSDDPKLTVRESSLSDDSFDSSFKTTSLKDRLMIRSNPESIKLASDSDDDSLPARKLPTKCRQLISDSSSDEEDIFRRHKPALLPKPPAKAEMDSDLEDLFVGLTVREVPVVTKPKKRVPRKLVVERPLESHRGRMSFLSSLSVNAPDDYRHPEALPYLKSFRKHRDELIQRLFTLFNREVFNNLLPRDFSITWNNRLTRTAGYCRHFTRRDGMTTTFESKIELSVKVVDTPCRLRDTLIHELCHASTWMLDNCRGGHGPVWRKWANIAVRTFPELPPISRCHNYEISYKFYYNCTVCSFSTGRHSKSVDTTTHVCPMCRGKLQLSSEPQNAGAGKETSDSVPQNVPKTPRTPNAFALFVKEHYASTKSSRPDLPHAAVMKLLSAKFADSKKQSQQFNTKHS